MSRLHAYCDVGSQSDDPCLNKATHLVRGWPWYRPDDELHVCEDHAREAESDGCRDVCNANGEEVTWDGEADAWKVVA